MLTSRVAAAVLLASIAGCGDGVQYTPITAPAHDCGTASNVSIDARGGTYSIIGLCDRVRLRGSGNTLSIASTKSIEVNGEDNTVTLQAMGDASVHGARNRVRYAKRVENNPNNTWITGDANSVAPGS